MNAAFSFTGKLPYEIFRQFSPQLHRATIDTLPPSPLVAIHLFFVYGGCGGFPILVWASLGDIFTSRRMCAIIILRTCKFYTATTENDFYVELN